jgi:hypothetical protein
MTRSNDSERLERELASRLDELAPQPGRGLRDRVLQATAAVQQRRGPMAWLTARAGMLPLAQASALLAVAVVALAVGIGIGASGWIGIVGRPTTSPTAAAPSVGATISATPSASIPLSTVYSSSRRAEIPDPTPHVFGGESVSGVVAFKGGYLAVGGINGGCCTGGYSTDTRAVVWRSSDGAHWVLEPNRPEFALGRMTGVATDGERIIVIGYRNLESATSPGDAEKHGALWISTDGLNWTLIGGDLNAIEQPIYSDIAFTSEGFLATTAALPGQEDAILASRDGMQWIAVADLQTLGTGTIESITPTLSGAVAVGWTSGGRGVDGTPRPDLAAVWPSGDGQSWGRITGSSVLGNGHIQSVAAMGEVVIAVGIDLTPGRLVIWRSTDAIHWQRTQMPGIAVDWSEPPTVVASERGFVILGLVTSGPRAALTVWTSPDGSAWSVVAVPPASGEVPALSVADALPLADGRLLIVGGVPGDPGHNVVPAAVILMP